MRLLAALLWMPALCAAACTPIQGTSITGRDLAAADGQFAGVPPELSVGFAPAPGLRRVFSQAELDRVAKRYGIAVEPRELCFEYAMHAMDSSAISAALQLLVPGAEMRIEEMNRYTIPDGKIVFALSSLPRPPGLNPDEPVVWRGSIEYAPGRKFTIWVKLRITVSTPQVMALREIPADHELAAADVEIRSARRFPSPQRVAEHLDQVLGRKTVRAFRAGSPLPSDGLRGANETADSKTPVVRGDSVKVTVESGLAHIVLDAKAESTAVEGGMVKLRNPKSGKLFEARVTGKGSAEIVAQAVSQ